MLDMQMVATDDGIGRVEGDEIALLDTAFPHLGAVLAETGSFDVLASAPVVRRVPMTEAVLRAPLGAPRALWGIGLNYHSKVTHTGREVPTDPILFLAASSAVVAPGACVPLPEGAVEQMDYEAELAVVIGAPMYQVGPDEVWAGIAGITAANDITARDVMRDTKIPALAKSFPGFKPLGASVCTLDEFADPDDVPVRSWVNGVLHQDDTSAGQIFPVPDLVSRISQYAPLLPGDVVLTGTPAGTGQDRGCFLGPGDEIRIEVGPVLPLTTAVTRTA